MGCLHRRIVPLSALGSCLLLVWVSSTSSQLRDITSGWEMDHRDIFAGLAELSNANLVYNCSSDYPYGVWFSATPPLADLPPPPREEPPLGPLGLGPGWEVGALGAAPRGALGCNGPTGPAFGVIGPMRAIPDPAAFPRPPQRGRSRVRGHQPGYWQRHSGRDPVYYARSRDGVEWEVYAGDDEWATAARPWAWKPVLDRGEEWFENEYAAHPSVVLKDGTYYMAYSSLGTQRQAIAKGQPGYYRDVTRTVETLEGDYVRVQDREWVPGIPDREADYVRACIMGAKSTDGIHWEKTRGPITIAVGEHTHRWEPSDLVGGMPPEYRGSYQRPSLLFDEGRWRLWYAYYLSGDCIAMGYRENRGDFMNPTHWDRGFATPDDAPLLRDWPNPSVARVFDKYYALSDRGRYSPTGTRGHLTMAESDDGFRWRVIGSLRPEGETNGVAEPEARVTEDDNGAWLNVFYTAVRAAAPHTDPQWGIRVTKRRLERRLLIPHLLCDWRYATRIADTGQEIESFSLFGRPGRWYCMAAGPGTPGVLYQGVNDRLATPFTSPDPTAEPFFTQEGLPDDLTDAQQMRGLFVRLLDPVTPLLCFGRAADGPPLAGAPSRMETLVLGRDGWKPHGPERPLGGRFLFQEDDCRDPMIIWDPTTLLYLMYYVGPPGGVQVRTSPDLLQWSEPTTVVACPPGYGTAEAPFVVQKEGYYYLFVSSEDHAQIAVYASLDPLDFGDAERDLLVELPGHAPEIVRADGVDYIACCSIRRPDDHDVKGVYLQELDWVE